MTVAPVTAITSRGSLEVAPFSDDRVLLKVLGDDGAIEATGTAYTKVLRDLCHGVVTALHAGEIGLARGNANAIQMRVVQGRFSSQVEPSILLQALDAAFGVGDDPL
jgi:hypothetical protein